jgi:NAD(P)-dependent dehydrogenase (short-subunit alcohol dehydrogenase family)
MNEQLLSGRRCLITGATSGIGRVASEQLAKAGARITLVARNRAKAEHAVAEIKASTGNDAVDFLLADLSSMDEVRALAETVRASFDALHILINNAGALFSRRHETVDGFEMTFALNHLAYFLLTRELRPLLTSSAPARIVNVASAAHARAGGGIDFDDLQAERRFRPFTAYARSKLANILFTRELARRLEGTGVTANCLHPGFVATGFAKNDGWLLKLGVTAAGLFGRTPTQEIGRAHV